MKLLFSGTLLRPALTFLLWRSNVLLGISSRETLDQSSLKDEVLQSQEYKHNSVCFNRHCWEYWKGRRF
jgi:hypothetical protein